MSIGYWDQVQAAGFEVPSDRPLDDLTAELTTMLGSTRPEVRDGTAFPALATWIERGVYDDLLAGLGDGMVAGLSVGLGETGTDTVFRRSFSALILAVCLEHDSAQHLLPRGQDHGVGRPDRDLVPRRARHPRLRARQGLGPRDRPRRRRHRRARAVPAPGRPRARPCCSTSWPSGSSAQPADEPLVAGRARPDRRRQSCGSCAATPSASTSSSRGCTASAPPPTPSGDRTTSDPYAPDGSRAGPSSVRCSSSSRWLRSRRRCGPTCCWSSIDALRMTNAPYLQVATD